MPLALLAAMLLQRRETARNELRSNSASGARRNPIPESTPEPDDKRIFFLFRKVGFDEDDAYTLVQELQNMAAANLIARFESKLDAMHSELGSVRGELSVQRWLMGLGFAALVAAAIAQLFRG